MTLIEIKKAAENKRTELFDKCGLFFAFSDKQFEENKTPLQEGEKYVSIGSGGYMPKSKVEEFKKGMDEIEKLRKESVKKGKLEKAEILHEILNHECYYTYDLTDVYALFNGVYSKEQINAVFTKNRKKYQDN